MKAANLLYFACSANLLTGLYILPMFFRYLARSTKVSESDIYFTEVFSLFFYYFFSGRPRSHAGSETNGLIFTKISGLVEIERA